MKNRKINFIKLGIFLFGISLFFSNCEDEEQIDFNSETFKQKPPVTSLKIAFNKSQHYKVVNEKIMKLNKKLNHNNTLKETTNYEDIVILTNQTLYTSYINTHTYSFRIKREQPQSFVENIVLHYNVTTNEYDEYLVQYYINSQEFLNIHNGNETQNLQNVIITKLDNGFFDAHSNREDGCQQVCETVYHECYSGAHDASNIDQWGNCDRAGTSDGPSAYQSCTTTCPNIDAGDSTGGGGSNSGVGGNSNGNPDPFDDEDVITNPLPNEPCDTGNGNIGVTNTNGDCTDITDLGPCQKTATLKEDDVFKQKMVALKNAADQWSFEQLFAVYDDPTPNTSPSQTDNYDYVSFRGTNHKPRANWEGNTTIKGIIHSHYSGTLSIFSVADLYDMYNILKNPNTSSNFFYGVVTNSGTAYILQIQNRAKFIEFGDKYLSTKRKRDNFIDHKYDGKYHINTNGSNNLNEKGFIKMLQDLGAGLNTYKPTDNTFSDYKKLSYNENTNQIDSDNCN